MAQDTSTSVLEIDIVYSCNSRITSYRDRSAFLRIFSSRRTETVVFTIKAMSYTGCIPVLWFSPFRGSCFFITGTLLFLIVNRCELSSHGSPSWVRNITMLSVCAKKLSWILIMLFVLESSVCMVLSMLDSSEMLSFSFSLSLLFWVLISWGPSVNEERGPTSRISMSLSILSEENSYCCLFLLVVCLYRVESSSVGYRSQYRFGEFYYVGTCEGVMVL